MSYATIDDLRSQLGGTQASSTPAYAAKMLHPFPKAAAVDRAAFMLARVTGRRVLEFGASGPMADRIRAAACTYCGVDRTASDGVVALDLDDGAAVLPSPAWTPEVIVCGEVIEHLTNPGWFLTRLKRQFPGVPVLITVPNAFAAAGHQHAERGVENVNIDHVAWYSPRTLMTLLEKVGFTLGEFAYYNGSGARAEGLIAVVR